jgi:hypothetical protein
LSFSAWVLLSAAVTAIAGGLLVASVSESSYNATENRAPEVRIAVASIATVARLAAVIVAVRQVRGRERRLGLLAALAMATVLLIVLEGIITLATGRT